MGRERERERERGFKRGFRASCWGEVFSARKGLRVLALGDWIWKRGAESVKNGSSRTRNSGS